MQATHHLGEMSRRRDFFYLVGTWESDNKYSKRYSSWFLSCSCSRELRFNWKKSCFFYAIYTVSYTAKNTIRIHHGLSVYDFAPFIENVCTVPVFLVFQVFHRASDCWVRFCVCGSRLLQLHTKLRPGGETFWAAEWWWRPQKLLGNYQCWFDINWKPQFRS